MTNDKNSLRKSIELIETLSGKVEKYNEPVAIVGIGMKLPGEANDLDTLWSLLDEGKSTAEEVPASRWDVDKWYDDNPNEPGKTYARRASFIRDVDLFDRKFFRVSPDEAASMDPMHRLLLECSWQALEDSATTQTELKNSQTGVFVGISTHEYAGQDHASADYGGFDATGSHMSFSSGRISYYLGVNGPSMAVDTACSSSLAAIHMAMHSLRNGECELALAGAAHLMLGPETFISLSRLKAISPDGLCKTFSAQADGYGRGEGCAVVALRPLSLAQKRGDRILGVIRESMLNHDGASSGLTAPNGLAQSALIKKALTRSKLQPEDIDYVECHGTGTDLGDPIEVESLQSVFGKGRQHPLMIGAVKSNMGHLEAAAGMASLLKVLACFRYNKIPRSLHCGELNPKIDWERYQVKVAQEATPWEKSDRPRRAGISSFGISGTNAHMILEEAPDRPKPEKEAEAKLPSRTYQLIPVSGEGAEALSDQSDHLIKHLNDYPDQAIEQVAYSLATTRSHFRRRTAIVAKDRNELLTRLSKPVETIIPEPGKLAFLYTGQGSQYIGMAKELYKTEPVFTQALDECLDLIEKETAEDFSPLLLGSSEPKDKDLIHQTEYTQLSLFVFEYSLTKLWQHWGIAPDILIGHSLGEIVAAAVAGVFSLRDGIRLVAARGRLMGSLPEGGKMYSVQTDRATITEHIKGREGVSLAAENGPNQVVVSGEADALDKLIKSLPKDTKAKELKTSHAFHSPLMETVMDEFHKVASSIIYSSPKIRLVSNVSGEVAGEEIATPDYWTRHIREEVLFKAGMLALEEAGATTYLEIGPQPTLTGMGAACISNSEDCQWLASIQPDKACGQTMLESLGKLHCAGFTVNWDKFYQDREQPKVSLPTYAFQRKRYWLNALPITMRGDTASHPLLGQGYQVGGEWVYEQVLSTDHFSYLSDHRVFGKVVVPAAGLAELVQAFIHEQLSEGHELSELLIEQPMILSESDQQKIQLVTERQSDGYGFVLYVTGNKSEGWQRYASGSMAISDPVGRSRISPDSLKNGLESVSIARLYDDFEASGLSYGPAFQCLHEAHSDGKQAVGYVTLDESSADGYGLHPGILDGIFQLTGYLIDFDSHGSYLPFEISGYRLLERSVTRLWARVTLKEHTDSQNTYEVSFWNEEGDVVGHISRFVVRFMSAEALSSASQESYHDWLYATQWETIKPKTGSLSIGNWQLRGDDFAMMEQLETLLQDQRLNLQRNDHLAEVPTDTRGLLSIWGEQEALDQSDMAVSAEKLTSLALQELQAAIRAGVEEVVWITTGVHSKASSLRLEQSPLWGLMRVAMNEHPEVSFRIIDLEGNDPDLYVPLCEAVKSSGQGEQLRISRRGTEVLRLSRLTIESGRPQVSRAPALDNPSERNMSSSTVLITGGLGALGLRVAQHLAINYHVGHLLLLGRKGPGNEAMEVIETLRKSGTKVTVVSCDVSDRQGVSEVITAVDPAYPLKGVVHAAAVLDDGILLSQTPERLKTTMDSKVYGAWNLHELTKDKNLELFVLFSSVASWLGAAGQSNYAAANLFLDQLSIYRQQLGLESSTINWGPVADVGLAASMSQEDRVRIENGGIGYLDLGQGLAAMDLAISQKRAQLGILPIRKRQLSHSLLSRHNMIPAFYSHVIQQNKAVKGQDFAERLKQLEGPDRSAFVKDYLLRLCAEILGKDPRALPMDASLKEEGVNSLLAVEIRNKLSKELNVKLPVTVIFDYPSLTDLSGFIIKSLDLGETRKFDIKEALTGLIASNIDNGNELIKRQSIRQAIANLIQMLEASETVDAMDKKLADEDIEKFSEEEILENLEDIFDQELDE